MSPTIAVGDRSHKSSFLQVSFESDAQGHLTKVQIFDTLRAPVIQECGKTMNKLGMGTH